MSRFRRFVLPAALLLAAGNRAAAADQPSAWAIVIGIDAYEDTVIPRCTGAAADARAIERWLVGDLGWPVNHVLRMDAQSSKTHGLPNVPIATLYPSRENVEWAARNWLRAGARKDDLVLIFFAGQAVGLKTSPRSRPGSLGRHFLLPIDARSDRLAAGGWDLADAIDDLAAKGENPILIWLDTSPNGRGSRAITPEQADPNAARWLAELTRWPGVAAWLAAQKGPSVERLKDAKTSPFVTALLSAIGPSSETRNLLGMLDRLNRHPALQAQGFRAVGGLSPDLTLWAREIGPRKRPPSELLLQQGHAQYVSHVAITPDGAQAISASGDATIRVWRLEDRALLRVLSNHIVEVSALAQSADGKILATGDGAGALRVWRLPEFQPLTMPAPRPHARGLSRICILPDRQHLASLDGGGTVMFWEIVGNTVRGQTIAQRASAIACDEGIIVVAGSEGGRDPWVHLFRADGKLARELPKPKGLVPLQGLVAANGSVIYGDRAGGLRSFDVAGDKERGSRDLPAPVTSLALTRSTVAVGLGDAIELLSPDLVPAKVTLHAPDAIEQLSWSLDSSHLAATTRSGRVVCWNRSEEAPGWNAISLEADARSATSGTSIAFAPDASALFAGCRDGELRQWDLPTGRQRQRIDAHRGQVASLSVSADGRYMLQVTKDERAQIWDLQEGRSLRVIDGRWQAGTFRGGGDRMAMTTGDGDVRLVNRASGTLSAAVFDRPRAEGSDKPTKWGFSAITTSLDGKYVTAVSPDGPLACVWKIDGGAPVRVIREHSDFITASRVSDDGKLVVTAGLDGEVKAWRLAEGNAPLWTIATGTDAEPNPVAALVLGPGELKWLITGHRDGRVIRWEIGPQGALKSRRLGQLEGEVHALVVSPDGRSLAAGGDDKAVWYWSLNDPSLVPRRFEPRHHERVNALAAFANGKVFASGSDDTTVKLWDLTDRSLLGTLAAMPAASEWVAFTPDPDCAFDSSPGAEREVAWMRDGKLMPLDQFYERCRVFQLTDRLRNADRPPVSLALRATIPPPTLTIDRPADRAPMRQTELAISLGTDDASDVRLYQNGVPVRDDSDFARLDPANPKRRLVNVTLRKGVNRFYALAARADHSSIDGRSNSVEVVYDGPDSPSRMFVLALGVGTYTNRPLKYAADDARSIARVLSRQGLADEITPDHVIVLTDKQVDEATVTKAFVRIRQDARPEDTFVLFLAGHTDVRRDRFGRDRFSLLLPSFPFPPGENLLALRGGADSVGGDDKPGTVLPYFLLYQQLIRVDALQRLVVIDACQAGAALDDPAVKRIQQRVAEKVDDEAHRARISYILASRDDEPALEAESLAHGLLTYLVLHGMGAPNLRPDPAPLPPNADRDGNQIVTTDELRRYVDDSLPLVADKVAGHVRRAGPRNTSVQTRPIEVQSTKEAEFDLVRLPKGN
jgi:WD40 repeat protein